MPRKRANEEARDNGAVADTERLVKIMGCHPFGRPGISLQDPRIQQTFSRTSVALDDTDDEDDADELGESGGMTVRPQPKKPSTAEVVPHLIDHYPFRSCDRSCVMAAARGDHRRRQAEDYNEVPVISCDYVFLTDSRQLTDEEALAVLVPHPYS